MDEPDLEARMMDAIDCWEGTSDRRLAEMCAREASEAVAAAVDAERAPLVAAIRNAMVLIEPLGDRNAALAYERLRDAL